MTPSNPFSQLDGYELRHLVQHLDQRGRGEELDRLLSKETEDGRNAWHAAKDAADDLAGYVADLGIALRRAESAERSAHLALLYTYMLASLNSLADQVPLELATQLVKARVWTPARGLAMAQADVRSRPARRRRCAALAGVVQESFVSLWQEAIDTVRGVTDSRERADAVATLAESAPESVRESLLDLALRINAPYWRARGLVDSGLCISSAEFKRNVLTRVVAVNVAIESPRQQLIILSRTLRLRAQLGEFAAAWVGLPEGKRVEIVSEVTDLFDSALIGGGLRAAAAIADPRQRDGTLASLVERLAALGDVAEALRVVESIKGAEYRSMALAGISAELAKQGNGAEALSIARQIARPAARNVRVGRCGTDSIRR